MADILGKFDFISYDGIKTRNILRQVKILSKNLKENGIFHPYIVKDGERPDSIAYDYYGSSDYTWLVYESNNIINPYEEWPLTDREFNQYLLKKYGYVDQLKNEILYYENPEFNFKKTVETLNADAIEDKVGWSPVFIFDWENELNTRKKHIRLLSSSYLDVIDKDVKSISEQLFNG